MKRSTPMRRTGFKRITREQATAIVEQAMTVGIPHIQRFDVYITPARQPPGECGSDTPMRRGNYETKTIGVPQPKREYVRSRALLEAVPKLMYCCLGSHHAVVCACHSNWAVHGKGKGIKADDNRIASGCLNCHHELDQGRQFTSAEKEAWFWRAHVETVRLLLSHGLWPAGVPVPETAHSPFTVNE